MNRLSVVIPSRTRSNLMACAGAVQECEPDARMIVVDDGLPWSIREEMLGVEFVSGIKPFCFSRNVNIGIRAAGTDDVIILGDDGLLESPGGFSLLQQAAEEHPEFGLIASTCDNVGNRNQFPRGIGLREDPRMVCFTAVLIPRRTIDLVGLMDQEFTGYGFDDDSYCLRVRRAGLKIGIHDSCFVNHSTLKSTFRSGEYPREMFDRNAEIFSRKYGADNHAL